MSKATEIEMITNSSGPDLDHIARILHLKREVLETSPVQTESDDVFRARLIATVQTGAYYQLTTREREVAEQLVLGKKNSEIAKALGCSVKTIDTHRGHILQKLEVRNNVELVRLAIRRGWHVVELEADAS